MIEPYRVTWDGLDAPRYVMARNAWEAEQLAGTPRSVTVYTRLAGADDIPELIEIITKVTAERSARAD